MFFKDCRFNGANADVLKCHFEGQKVQFQGRIEIVFTVNIKCDFKKGSLETI